MVESQLEWAGQWHGDDWVISGVFITLVILSLASWTMIVYKGWHFWRLEQLERRVVAELLNRDDCRETGQWVSQGTLSYLILQELAKLPPGAHGNGAVEMQSHHLEHHAERLTHGYRVELESYLTGLATIGNSAPFIGLLGTVWGIMHALQGLGGAEGISMDIVAGPVGEALVATALGLFVAIPAVVGYNLLLRRLRQLNVLVERNLRHFIYLTAMDEVCPQRVVGAG